MSDPNTAADVTQKVWLKLVESPQLYKAQGQFQAWLFTVGHRMLIDEIRRHKRWTYDDDVDALPDEHEECGADQWDEARRHRHTFLQHWRAPPTKDMPIADTARV